MNLIAKRTSKFDGCVSCPGDKSISQRILIMGALINENLEIDNFLNGDIQELINKLISEDQAKKIAENMNNA